MKSDADTVDAYIAEAPPERRPALERLRDLCREALPDADELILYGMPSYRQDGTLWVCFASQKNHLSIYGTHGAAAAHEAALGRFDKGKGCYRYRKTDDIGWDGWRAALADVGERASSASAGP